MWKNVVAMDTTERLYRFTSSTNRVNHGVVTRRTEAGVYAVFDTFGSADGRTLPARYGFVALTPNPYVEDTAAHGELLTLTPDVQWTNSTVARVASAALAGDFDAWWQASAIEIITELKQQ